VPVAIAPLLMSEEALWQKEVQMVLRSRHRNIEQPPFFLDLSGAAGAEVGRDAAIDHI
jgi:hypothetical protein